MRVIVALMRIQIQSEFVAFPLPLYSLKMGMGRPDSGLGPGSMASRLILEVMGRPISPKYYGLNGSLDIMGRSKYFSIILNYEYYEHF